MTGENLSLDEISETAKPILNKHGVVKAEIFGSYARGEQKNDSDIDFLVEFESDKTLVDVANLKNELEKELGRNVDVLTYDSVHPDIRDQVFSEAAEI